jgi:hypothetical protein
MSFADDCSFDVDSKNGGSISSALNKCLDWVDLVNVSDAKVDGNFWTQIKSWTNNIALYLWIFAVWSIVFGGLMMTLSAWEEEKIKKAKDIVKWWIIWFIWLITASAIINLVVKIMYSI